MVERIDAMFAAGDSPPSIVVFVDRGLRRICLGAPRNDEFFLDLGAQALAEELLRLGIDHSLDLFDGTHEDAYHRIPSAVRQLVSALSGA
jgi:hypothetical protein